MCQDNYSILAGSICNIIDITLPRHNLLTLMARILLFFFLNRCYFLSSCPCEPLPPLVSPLQPPTATFPPVSTPLLKATHYSFLATLEVLGKLSFSALSGGLVDWVGFAIAYLLFFSLSAASALLVWKATLTGPLKEQTNTSHSEK